MKVDKNKEPPPVVVAEVVLCRRLSLLLLTYTTYCNYEIYGVRHWPVLRFIAFTCNEASLVECACCLPSSGKQAVLSFNLRHM